MTAALKRFYNHVAKQPCLVCGDYGVEVAHLALMPSRKAVGFIPRRKDEAVFCAIPLCPEHHVNGEDSVHKLGEANFIASLGKPDGWVSGYVARLIVEALT